MSDSGLYGAVYAQLHDWAELIDDVIVDLEVAGGSDGAERREVLSSLLRGLQTAPASDLSAALLWNVLREYKSPSHADWNEIADAIARCDASSGVVGRLEELARVLELERAEMSTRMRGSHAL